MTEAEWNACDDPRPMLEFLRDRASERKLRLFGVACVRRVWPLLTHEESRRAVDIAEDHADGKATGEELAAAWSSAALAADYSVSMTGDASIAAAGACVPGGHRLARIVAITAALAALAVGAAEERRRQAALLRDLFRKPTDGAHCMPSRFAWSDGAIRKMALAIHEQRAFDRLQQLADVLEDAGCTDADILSHCRTPGEHVRGCWVVDLLLGKQ